MGATTTDEASIRPTLLAGALAVVCAVMVTITVGSEPRPALAHSPDDFTLTEVITGLT